MKTQLIKQLKKNPCWEESPSNLQQKLKKQKQPYIISPGDTPETFSFFYLDQSIKKVEFELESSSNSWLYRNGIDIRSDDFNKIADYILKPKK